MNVILIPRVIKGQKGKTVIYKLENFRFDEDNKLKWDNFKFYTPVGDKVENGFNYFDVPGGEILIERESDLDKYVMIVIRKEEGIEWYEEFDGASGGADLSIGIEGDMVVIGFIPADENENVEIMVKEVIDG